MIKQGVLEARGARFSTLEAGEGPLVLLLHGFPDTPRSLEGLIVALAEAGYRAVAPTLRGYEVSSLEGPRRLADCAQDVLAQADALGAQRFHLIGHDWGAAIAYAVGSTAPERLASLVTLAVPHLGQVGRVLFRDPDQLRRSAYMLRFQVSGEAALTRGYVRTLWRRWWAEGEPPEALMAAAEATLAERPVATAALSYYRQFLRPGLAESWALLQSEVGAPTLALCGEWDGCISSTSHGLALSPSFFPAGLLRVVIEGAGHWPHLERPEQTRAAILEWLETHSA
ncbi:MAG: alpha/beta hydrolase [Alphaproteobacteria bacterium]|nr:alpha/beta hydrolase [Alphaproteobacteria bacterium]